MSLELNFILLALGAVLIILALAGRRLFGAMKTGPRGALRAVLTVAGVAAIGTPLAVGGLVSQLQSPGTQAPPPPPIISIKPAPPSAGLALDVVATASNAITSCPDTTPPSLPDGATATLAQMNAARAAFEAYDQATNAYAKCVDDTVARIAQGRSSDSSAADLDRLQDFGTRAHNVAIDKEQALADQFNKQIRAYKAKHPK